MPMTMKHPEPLVLVDRHEPFSLGFKGGWRVRIRVRDEIELCRLVVHCYVYVSRFILFNLKRAVPCWKAIRTKLIDHLLRAEPWRQTPHHGSNGKHSYNTEDSDNKTNCVVTFWSFGLLLRVLHPGTPYCCQLI